MDLEVVFESRSSKIRIRSSAFIALEALGRALSSPDLGNDTFIVAGHSAVEGRNDEYSQELSEQRASSVKRFLIENFELAPDRIITVGYGSSKPKNVQDLYAQENQRVQIVNMGTSAQK
nr:OmpA family protein [Bradyrhizobium manausense]